MFDLSLLKETGTAARRQRPAIRRFVSIFILIVEAIDERVDF